MFGKSYIDSTYNHQPSTIAKGDMRKQPIIGTFVQIYYFVVGAAAIPVRLLLRENFGERSISPLAWGISLFLHFWYIFEYLGKFIGLNLSPRFLIYEDPDFSVMEVVILSILIIVNGFFIYIINTFFLKGFKHFRTIVDKAKRGELPNDSYYRGNGKYFRHLLGRRIKTPVGRFIVDEDILRIVVEPFMMLIFTLIGFFVTVVIAIILSVIPTVIPLVISAFISSFAGTFIVIGISAICLFLEELGIYLRPRYAALDMIDGQIDLDRISKIKMDIISRKISEKSDVLDEKEPSFVKICCDEK